MLPVSQSNESHVIEFQVITQGKRPPPHWQQELQPHYSVPSAPASCLPRAGLGGPWCHKQDAKMSMEALEGCVRVFWSVWALGEAGAAARAQLPSAPKQL